MSKLETSSKAPDPGTTPKGAKAVVTTDKTEASQPATDKAVRPKEIGGPKGPEPTRFGDWERDGRCVDF
ncbi:MAG: succinate dehydrogenase assembly factor 4 [Alphaproteobacteria bacterium]